MFASISFFSPPVYLVNRNIFPFKKEAACLPFAHLRDGGLMRMLVTRSLSVFSVLLSRTLGAVLVWDGFLLLITFC